MPTNETRRELLNRVKSTGYPGGITEVFQAADQGIDLVDQYQMQQEQQQMQVANTPQEQEVGLREQHAMGNTQASMVFPNVQPNQSFNTVGMQAPINIDKIDNQGHLVESYQNVPPGIQNLPTGPSEGTVIESPAAYQTGGIRDNMMNYLHNTGRDTTYVNIVMNAISHHESKNNPNQVQVSQKDDGTFYDGPGRGKYQYEVGKKGGGNTAINRTKLFLDNFTDKTLSDYPKLKALHKNKSLDFRNLTSKEQDALFIGDKIYGGDDRQAAFDAVTKNRTTPPSQEEVFKYWLKNHKGKVNGKPIHKLTDDEIEVERKKWNSRTKNLFKTGGFKAKFQW